MKPTKLLALAVCILFGVGIGLFACQLSQKQNEAYLPPNVYGLPLSEFWEVVLQETKASNESALNWFYVTTDEKGNLKHLILEFSEVTDCKPCKTYHVEYINGKLKYYSAEVEHVKAGLHPLAIFRELEKLDFREILRAYPYKSFVIDAEMESGRVGYSSNYTKVYLLLNGSLIPLKRIIFDSEIPWCRITISKMKYAKNGSIVEGCSVGGIVVFLPEDLDKAPVAEPSIDITPKVGEHLTNEFLTNNKTKILLKDAKLTLCTLNETCLPSRNWQECRLRTSLRLDRSTLKEWRGERVV